MIHIELNSFSSRRWGLMGLLLGGLTAFFAAALAVALLFGRVLILSAAVYWLWPLIFSKEFTRWVFGADTVSFWKTLLLISVVAAVGSMLRRKSVSFKSRRRYGTPTRVDVIDI